ncbi:MAG: tyrosine-type recombinase/integrase [Dehalococcoidales bacterium]|nr:tyrosine-type recombinase/integrase [Dehalococcoidales bacterium]
MRQKDKGTRLMKIPDIEELIKLYEISNRVENKSPRTVAWYSEMLTSFTRYLDTVHLPHDLSIFSIDTVRAYILYLRQRRRFEGHPYTPQQDKTLSPKTIQCHVRALRAFSSWLFAEGHTTENRLGKLKLPKAPVTMTTPLTPEEIKTCSSSIDKDSTMGVRNYTIIIIALDTGLRISEIIGISLANINLIDGYIKVLGKGSKERIVPIGKFVQRKLLFYIENARPKPASGEINNLFLSASGNPMTANSIKLVFSRIARSSGVKRLHAHLCRHTFSINYLLNGGDVFSLKEILGHSSLEMVNHYLHFTSSQITAQHHKYSPMDKLTGEHE